MLVRSICFLLLFGSVLLVDFSLWQRAAKRERLVYGFLMLPILYLGVMFAAGKFWPNLDELMDWLLAEPAERIVRFLKPQS
ncbi:hypothetical protein OB236_14475 [Paenibacillus sp. WQ 127069]|uniref:Uncharacterized protein n=1 Tax=Paenibacillus baimaensis TaxID=2982185 RepID=A0ABT2UF96_9BACL|nr:hypothetical protein [Paenibacillus sp. WQ 127069]MCU6793318.1 hypothetical protein [Paenibacillus sp. WQ 127069]